MAEGAEKKCDEGLPPWMATFADMMALLMCFFVLLLSFAEIDAIRFKKMAESMKDAFGVQQEIPAVEIVKGISVVTQSFSPSVGTPSVMEEIRQETTETEKEHLEVNQGDLEQGNLAEGAAFEAVPTEGGEMAQNLELNANVMDAVEQKLREDAQAQAEELRATLQQEIEDGLITIETDATNVIVRINEKGSFPSGSADLNPGFLEVIDRIAVALSTHPGKIIVAGHTDNRPISTARFRSNWELSSARAVTVVHALLNDPTMDPERFLIEGYADTDPLAPNDTPENRALNRRVELIIKHGQDVLSDEVIHAREVNAAGGETPAAQPDAAAAEGGSDGVAADGGPTNDTGEMANEQ
ncbi:MAG TPA: type VI secretion system protein TssL [Sedimenticola sp.]|nr:type VI secretion system protein TssL [Sedimenticola sp.]